MRQLKNYDSAELDSEFRQMSTSIRAGPLENQYRQCNDICCVITFIVMVIATLVIGAIMINDGKEVYNINGEDIQTTGFGEFSETVKKYAGAIIAMFALAFILSILYLLLIKKFPKCMIYTMIGLFFLILAALIVLGIINQQWWMVIVFAITAFIMACLLFCFRDRIRTGIVLLKMACQFITEKPTVYLAPLYPFFFGLLFFIFWLVSLISVSYTTYKKQKQVEGTEQSADTSKETAFIVLWVFIFVFMSEFLYYVQTFLISTACANWYYGIDENYCSTGIPRLNRFHLGSLTFGALIVTIVNMLKRAASSEAQEQDGIAAICLCIVACCLSCIQDLLQTLNHNAVIVMAVTGESYIGSAKTALGLIFQDYGLFYVADFFADLVTFFGIVFCAGIPTIVGFLIIRYGQNSQDVEASYAIILIFFLSLLIAGVIVGMIGEALSCVFIYYCFDRKFISMGINVDNCPPTIRNYRNGADAPYGSGQQLREKY